MKQNALLVIDVQKGLDDMSLLLAAWRKYQQPIIHIQHCFEANSLLRPEPPGNDFKDVAKPLAGETIFKKSTNSAFVNTTPFLLNRF